MTSYAVTPFYIEPVCFTCAGEAGQQAKTFGELADKAPELIWDASGLTFTCPSCGARWSWRSFALGVPYTKVASLEAP